MFNWFKKKIVKIKDPLFGEMTFMGSYWEGFCIFEPTDSEIEIFVDGDKTGLTGSQHLFFEKLLAKYDSLEPQIYELLTREGEAWVSGKIEDPKETFQLSAISLPDEETDEMEWTLMFESNLQGTPSFDIEFKSWQATGVIEVST